jgi:hypothetical protein
MATLRQKIQAEAKMRELLAENGLPEPDGIEYGHTCIRLFFNEPKVALIIDIDEPPPGFEQVGVRLDGDEEPDLALAYDDEDTPPALDHAADDPPALERDDEEPPSELKCGDEDLEYGYLEWRRDRCRRTSGNR